MFSETLQLETLRQKIDEARDQSGSQADYLDRGNPNAAQAKKAQEMMAEYTRQAAAMEAELTQLLTGIRSQKPQAVNEWVDFHVGILKTIAAEKGGDPTKNARIMVARNTLQEWEKLRQGELNFVSINSFFLKDYRAQVKRLVGGAGTPSSQKVEDKAWWQFWK
jgi:hypothetical protein